MDGFHYVYGCVKGNKGPGRTKSYVSKGSENFMDLTSKGEVLGKALPTKGDQGPF